MTEIEPGLPLAASVEVPGRLPSTLVLLLTGSRAPKPVPQTCALSTVCVLPWDTSRDAPQTPGAEVLAPELVPVPPLTRVPHPLTLPRVLGTEFVPRRLCTLHSHCFSGHRATLRWRGRAGPSFQIKRLRL